jgi:hypothetical protein
VLTSGNSAYDWLMSDDPFYSPFRPNPPERLPPAARVARTLTKDSHRKSRGLFFQGESYGCELQLRDDDVLEFAQRFIFREAAENDFTSATS